VTRPSPWTSAVAAIALCAALSVTSAEAASSACQPAGAHGAKVCRNARPGARTSLALKIGARSVVAQGLLLTRGTATTYRFKYSVAGSQAAFTRSAHTPLSHAPVLVWATLRGLRPDRAYRYQVIASNRFGTSYGTIERFVTTSRTARTSASPKPVRPATPITAPIGSSTSPPATPPTPTPAQTPTTPAAPDTGPATTILAPVTSNQPAPARSMLWGADIGTQLTGTLAPWDMTPVTDFAQMVGKAPSVLPFNIPFLECDSAPCYWYWFPTALMNSIRGYGAIPMINWGSMSSPLNVDEPGFSLSNVINGVYDTYIRQFAQEAKAWGDPFFLRFDWEMNGNWFPWNEGVNGNQPGQFITAWRHVHDIFASAGATNVNWVWCPAVTETGVTTSLSELYPGDSYVDWTCVDGYNWGTALHGPNGWQTFDQVFGATYDDITTAIAPAKPMMIGEVGASETGGSKAAWITDMFNELTTVYSQIQALLWFDKDESIDAAVETSASSLAAFSHGVAGSQYLTNGYSGLNASTIGFS
jgi:Glycosyl hydrolase family 26